MKKELALDYISNSMSLRAPQEKSLRLFADYLDSPAGINLINTLKRQERNPTDYIEKTAIDYFTQINETKNFKGFDGRSYPTFTYALATGVGKTRLMGAFVTYLYLVYGIKHFMIVAPGNTIYRKLLDDFGKSNNPKYVFKGIAELNSSNIKIIHKDNYTNQNHELGYYKNNIEINILNIQQFSQKDIEKQKGITKGSENFGVKNGRLLSYFDYLSELDDLVVLLDESHHYHADAAFQSLDRLSPLFGLEFTATPYTGEFIGRRRERTPKMKESIVYLYNLGDAIKDGFVKDPYIGTEQDVNFANYNTDSIETDLKKLQLAVYFHERAKSSIQKYALDNNLRVVKPVMLIVAKDINHAEELFSKISSKDFRGGEFIGKVLVVHSNNTSESDYTVEQLISLENPKNYIEVIIHVNMLKEGWDVSNIYTIVPLRTSAALILTEQTIGRGLRLPYGERTGVKIVDRVVIVAHGEYQKVVEQAQNSTIIQPSNIEVISNIEKAEIKTTLQIKSYQLEKLEDEIKSNSLIQEELIIKAREDLEETFNDETTEEYKEQAIENQVSKLNEDLIKISSIATFSKSKSEVVDQIDIYNEDTLFSSLSKDSKEEIKNILKKTSDDIEQRNILIPRLFVTPSYKTLTFNDFDLDTSELKKYDPKIRIIETRLQGDENTNILGETTYENQRSSVSSISPLEGFFFQSPIKTLISALCDEPLVDYEDPNQKMLLIKLTKQAISFYETFYSNKAIMIRLIENYAHDIAKIIYNQLRKNAVFSDELDQSSIGAPKPYLEQHNITVIEGEVGVSLESQINTFSKDRIYTHFKKACHSHYKFDSSDEARFAYLLDNDNDVIDWLRPAPKQFDNYLLWRDQEGHADNRYEPDFVVELKDEILLVEIKPTSELNNYDVNAKRKTAEKYCSAVNENLGKFGITKKWRYKIIPTEYINIFSSVQFLIS